MVELVENFQFSGDRDMHLDDRLPGISGYIRTRNGGRFLEKVIRSHINHLDEIVVVFNDSIDDTREILERLSGEFDRKLRAYEYLPKVFPPGSEGHRKTPSNSPNSMVNYSNLAISKTTYAVLVKIDDDHLAREKEFSEITKRVRGGELTRSDYWVFSGPNVLKNAETGLWDLYRHEPISGAGDVGFFHTAPGRYYQHDRRFETLNRSGMRRQFVGLLYHHLKYLKPGFGFSNHDVLGSGTTRHRKKWNQFNLPNRHMSISEYLSTQATRRESLRERLLSLTEKGRLLQARDTYTKANLPSINFNQELASLKI